MEGMKSDRYLGIYVLYPVPYNGSPTIRLTFVTSHSFYLIIEKYLLDSFSHDGFPARHLPFRRNTDAIGKIKSFFLDYFILILSSLERFVNIDNVTNGQKKKKIIIIMQRLDSKIRINRWKHILYPPCSECQGCYND